MATKLFISYRRDNAGIYARLLHQLLKEKKYKVFLDTEGLGPGLFNEQLLRQIERCDYFILLLTEGALSRPFVQREVKHALDHNKKIIPIVDEQFRYPNVLPEPFKNLPSYQSIETNTSDTTQVNYVVQQLQEVYLPKSRSWFKYLLICLMPLIIVVAFYNLSSQTPPQPPETLNGNNVTFKANERIINGSNNEIIGDSNEIHGNNNNIHGNYNRIYGSNNTCYGHGNEFISGSNNKMFVSNETLPVVVGPEETNTEIPATRDKGDPEFNQPIIPPENDGSQTNPPSEKGQTTKKPESKPEPPSQPPKFNQKPLNGSNTTFKANGRIINGSNDEIIGNGNKINGSNNEITGDSNEIHGSNNEIHGNYNRIYGSNNTCYGHGNEFISGSNNEEI